MAFNLSQFDEPDSTEMAQSTSDNAFFRGTISERRRPSVLFGRSRGTSGSAAIRDFPAKIAHLKEDKLRFPKHEELQRAMNDYQLAAKEDIMSINMMEKEQGNWSVVGLVDPNKHLSTLDHSVHAGPAGQLRLAYASIPDVATIKRISS